MTPSDQHERLRQIPPVGDLLHSPRARGWLEQHPASLVTDCLRAATAECRKRVLEAGEFLPSVEYVLERAEALLAQRSRPNLRAAINATGVILHTGLGRAVFPSGVVDSLRDEMAGYCTLAVDLETGERIERDELVEGLLCELTGAEAATVVNNNAAATLLVLAALACGKEVIVSRGQLIEIGGSFRLPEVMSQSGARLVEVGATNRTHLADYARACTTETAAILRVHPSNYRIVGFTAEPKLKELAELARGRGVLLIDDLGAGALVPLEPFGLPHEPTVRESVEAGADVVLFSGDKLIGAAQSGILVGRKELIQRLRKHPLMRAVRVDKTCLMVLERTLKLFREPASLIREHPTYRMMSESLEVLRRRAESLLARLKASGCGAGAEIINSHAYLGSGSLPTEAIPSLAVALNLPGTGPAEVARRLRVGTTAVFGRIQDDRLLLDVRTVSDAQVPTLAEAVAQTARG